MCFTATRSSCAIDRVWVSIHHCCRGSELLLRLSPMGCTHCCPGLAQTQLTKASVHQGSLTLRFSHLLSTRLIHTVVGLNPTGWLKMLTSLLHGQLKTVKLEGGGFSEGEGSNERCWGKVLRCTYYHTECTSTMYNRTKTYYWRSLPEEPLKTQLHFPFGGRLCSVFVF